MSILPGRDRHGQSSLEFMAMISIALVLFAGFFTFFADRQMTAHAIQQQRLATTTAEKAAFELDLALTQGDGFSRIFDLQETIEGEDYTVTVINETVVLTYKETDILAYTAAENVTGDIQPGTNRVRNEEGVLHVSQP